MGGGGGHMGGGGGHEDQEAGGGPGGGGGGGGEEEGYGNNLSTPVVFAEGFGILGLPTTVDTGLRPRPEDDNPDVLEYFDPSEVYVKDGVTYYPQQTPSHWQAQWRAGVPGTPEPAIVNWSDNLTRQKWTARSTIRVETVLYQNPTDTMNAYSMQSLLGDSRTEVFGTTGQQYASTYRNVYSVNARIRIEKLLGRAGPVDTSVPAITDAVYESLGVDGPGGYAAEVNGAGSLIYGYNWALRQASLTNEQKIGWWRLTFQLDPLAEYTISEEGGTSQSFSVPRNVAFSAVDAGDTGDDVLHKPTLQNPTTSVLEIEITERRVGGQPNPTEAYTLTILTPSNGTVKAPGIECGVTGTTCAVTLPVGTWVPLEAVPAPGYEFGAWTGDAECLDGFVVLSANTTCSATFVSSGPPPATGLVRLTVVRPTGGTIYGAAIVCGDGGSMCTVDLPAGIVIGLDAVPAPGSTFTGWSAECPNGQVTMTANRTCTPTFSGGVPPPPPSTGFVRLTIVRPAGGTIYAAGIICGDAGDACAVDMPTGIQLGLEAVPTPGFKLDSWGAGCGPTVTLNAPLTCTPLFTPNEASLERVSAKDR